MKGISIILAAFLLLITGCTTTAKRNWSEEKILNQFPNASFYTRGYASYYGRHWAGRKTANGEIFDPKNLTAASKTLPFNTRVLVQNLRNGQFVVVRINDRGPFVRNRIIDLSSAAAKKIGMLQEGVAEVNLYLLRPDHKS